MPSKKQPARKHKKSSPTGRTKKPRTGPSSLRADLPALKALTQRQLDVVGLGLIAVAVFLAFVLYFGASGGQVGSALADALGFLFGKLYLLVPVVTAAIGAVLILRPILPTTRPLRTGAVCIWAGIALMLAAGTFGLAAGPRGEFWNPALFEERGGLVGEALYFVTAQPLSQLGSHIVSIFLFLIGLTLVTGGTLAGVLKATGGQVAATTTKVVRATSRRDTSSTTAATGESSLVPPEPEDAELVIHKRPLDGEDSIPDLFSDHEEPEEIAVVDGAGLELELYENEGDYAYDAAEDEEEEADESEAEEQEVVAGPARDVSEAELTPQGRYRASVTDDPDFIWTTPDAEKLKRSSARAAEPDTAGQEKNAQRLVEALGHFGIESKVVNTVAGPHITRFELRLAPGTKMSAVAKLRDDLAYALAATEIRILAPIPGKQAVGVEVPNAKRKIVHLGDVNDEAPKGSSPLFVWLGKDVSGKAVGADLAKMPHLLVAGTTGAGKSGCINAMLTGILLRSSPKDVRMVLVDPKQVELNHYESIPHLLTPVITNPRKAATALQNLVREMEQRYSLMSLHRARKLEELNRMRVKRGEEELPYIVCVIDELSDLMMVAPADVEDSIIRIAQKARAVGIHLVLATQSPRKDVITGLIKANVPSRIAFAVGSQIDSRVILDQNGAETLLGQGDMLFAPLGSSKLERIQGAYIDEDQIAGVTEHWRKQAEPEFREDLLEEIETEEPESTESDHLNPDDDPLLAEAIQMVVQMGTASTSMLQRRLRLGYTRAGRLIDMLERRGVISGYEGSKPRQVLISEVEMARLLEHLVPTAADSDTATQAEPATTEHATA